MRLQLVLLPMVALSLPYMLDRNQRILAVESSPQRLTVDNGASYLEKRELQRAMRDLEIDKFVLEFRDKMLRLLHMSRLSRVHAFGAQSEEDCEEDKVTEAECEEDKVTEDDCEEDKVTEDECEDEEESEPDCDDKLPSRIIVHNGDECASDPKKYIDMIRNSDPHKVSASQYMIIEAKDLQMSDHMAGLLQERFGLAENVDFRLFNGDEINRWLL